MATRADITPELCRQLLRYEPETGKLFWRERSAEFFNPTIGRWGAVKSADSIALGWNNKYAGAEAFTANSRGYRTGRILDLQFFAHRVIWAMVHDEWPAEGMDVDHINGNPADNRIANLRCVSHQDNGRNVKRPANNTSGRIGVSQDKRTGHWAAYIGHGKDRNRIGTFASFEDACQARANAEAQEGYHDNHGR